MCFLPLYRIAIYVGRAGLYVRSVKYITQKPSRRISCQLEALWDPSLTAFLQFVADGVFYAELNELLTRELAEHGYSGVDVRVTPLKTEIIIRATRTQNVLGRLSVAVSTYLWQQFNMLSNPKSRQQIEGILNLQSS